MSYTEFNFGSAETFYSAVLLISDHDRPDTVRTLTQLLHNPADNSAEDADNVAEGYETGGPVKGLRFGWQTAGGEQFETAIIMSQETAKRLAGGPSEAREDDLRKGGCVFGNVMKELLRSFLDAEYEHTATDDRQDPKSGATEAGQDPTGVTVGFLIGSAP